MKFKKMNKRGNIFLGITVAIIIWFAGILFIPFITDDITTFRTAMDCTNTSISGSTMINCLGASAIIPYLIWTFLSVSLGYIVGSNT